MSQYALLRTFRRGGVKRSLLTAVFALVLGLTLLSGCGGGGSGTLAEVGDREVTADYYKDRLGQLTLAELPRDANGELHDTSSMQSKRAFLDIIVNKELMVLKAIDLGYDETEEYINAERVVTQIMARDRMHAELISVTEDQVTDAEVEDYYARRQEKRHFQFIICNFEDDALEARQKILDGELWEDVAAEYNDGSPGPNNDYTMSLQYGIADDVFENAMFSLEIGELSMPVDTVYGFWIVRYNRLEEVRERPLDDDYRAQIKRVIAQRRARLLEETFLAESKEKHEFFMDEGALWLVFQGLPDDEGYLDPDTQQPIPKEELQPLNIPVEESDRVFFSVKFDLDEEADVWTLGRYKAKYGEMSAFQRPKKNKMLGGVRRQIVTDMVVKGLLMAESKERGYREDPRVVADVTQRLEEMMIDRFHNDVIKYEEFVSAEAISDFWTQNMEMFKTAELREGYLVACETEELANEARAAILAGEPWDDVYDRFARTKDAVTKGAVTVARDQMSPERDAIFAVDGVGDVTEPFMTQIGWAVMRLDNIVPPAQKEMTDVTNEISQRIKLQRKDEALKAKLALWNEEFGVTVNEDALAQMPSWDDLQTVE